MFRSNQDHNINPQRELAYKPSVAQGWGGRNVELPRGKCRIYTQFILNEYWLLCH